MPILFVALAVFVSLVAAPAKAAPPTFVNVCTGLGISLPALQPVAGATDNVLGGLLDTVLNPVIGDVNVNLQQALSGKAIGLGVLDPATNTFVSVPASQCNVTANTFSSTNSNGISIGGGQVTGLGGASGGLASAGDPSAIAFGNGASTAASATGAVAIGNGAAANQAGAVALGAGSMALRGSLVNYSAFGLPTPQTSSGEVSIGTSSAQRQITNLAAGQSGTDAVNVAQLSGAAGNLGTSLKTIIGAGATYDSTTGKVTAPTFTVQGGSYTTIGGAFDAVDTALSAGGGGGSGPFASDNTAAAGLPSASGANATAGGYGASAQGDRSLVLGNAASDNAVANSVVLGNGASVASGLGGSNVVIGQGSSGLRGSLAGYSAFGVAAPQTSSGEVSIGTSGAQRQITNLAAGQSATDAVNVAQLSGAAGNLGTSLKTIIGAGATYDATTGKVTAPTFTVQGGSYTTIGSAFDAVDTALSASGSGPVASDNTAAAARPSASGANATAGGYGASAQGNRSLVLGNTASDNAVADSVVLGNGARVASGLGGSNVVIGQGSTGARGALIGYSAFGVAAPQTSSGEVSVGTSSAQRQITNLAAGQTLTDAVNVAQLTGAAGNLGTSLKTIVGAGATYDATTGKVTAPTFTVQGGSYTTIGSAFDAVDTALTSGTGGGGGPKAFASDNTAAAPLASATAADATAGGYGASAHGKASLVLGNSASDHGVANSVVLGKGASVAAGLAGSNVVIGQGAVDLRGSLTGYAAFGLAAPDTSAGELSVGSANARRQVTNVAAGQAPTDAVNMAQLSGSAGNLGTSLKTIIGGGAGYDSTNGTVTTPGFTVGTATYTTIGSALAALDRSVGAPAVEYSTAGTPTTPNPGFASNDVTLVGGGAGPVSLHNVAAGKLGSGSTDAVNGGQVYAGNQGVANILGGGATYNTTTGSFGGPNYVINGASYTTIGSALNALSSEIGGSGSQKYFQANSSLGAASAGGADAVAVGPLARAAAGSAVALGNGASALGTNSVALGAGSSDGGLANVVSVGSAGAERRITNVAAGTLSATSTDAVNGSQLYQTDSRIASLTHSSVQYATDGTGRTLSSITLSSDAGGPVVIHNLAPGVAPDDAATVRQVRTSSRNSVQYSTADGVRSNTIALAGGSDGPVTIGNLASAVAVSDAVNLTQLQSYSATSAALANAYTDQKFNNLAAFTQSEIQKARTDAAGGTSLALAASGLRYEDGPGKTSIAGATAYYDGQMGLAFGLGHTSQDGRLRFNASVTASPTMTTTQVGAVVGLSVSLK